MSGGMIRARVEDATAPTSEMKIFKSGIMIPKKTASRIRVM